MDKGLISKIYKQMIQLNPRKKKKKPNQIVGKRPKQNQNYNEISPHTGQNDHYQKVYKQ